MERLSRRRRETKYQLVFLERSWPLEYKSDANLFPYTMGAEIIVRYIPNFLFLLEFLRNYPTM
jgi:hypothetical protein